MLGFRIAALRKRKGLSQEQLAMQINVCASAIGMYEQGRREPSLKTLIAISQEFGISLDYLITGEEPPNRNVERITGILFNLRDDLSGIPEPLLLSESELNKVMAALQC